MSADGFSRPEGPAEKEKAMRLVVKGNQLNHFENDLGQLFDSCVRGTASTESAWSPVVDLVETPDLFRITLELPGVKKEDVKVEFHEDVLTISGEKKAPIRNENETWHRVERRQGSFTRSFRFPSTVNPEAIAAAVIDGVLTVSVSKAEESKPREIPVEF